MDTSFLDSLCESWPQIRLLTSSQTVPMERLRRERYGIDGYCTHPDAADRYWVHSRRGKIFSTDPSPPVHGPQRPPRPPHHLLRGERADQLVFLRCPGPGQAGEYFGFFGFFGWWQRSHLLAFDELRLAPMTSTWQGAFTAPAPPETVLFLDPSNRPYTCK
jgi:hypothetical protein